MMGVTRMDENTLIEVIKGGISLANSTVSAIVGALLTTLFLRKNTKASEFEKIKAAKFGDVVDGLLENGKMTYLEYYKCRNFLRIAKKADEKYKKNEGEVKNESVQYDFDWFVRFYDYASNISNEDMQEIWASVFEHEVREPGTSSISLLHALSMMNREQAELFCNISRFALRDIKNYSPQLLLFVSTNREAYKNTEITPEKLKQLEHLGLIDCDFNSEYVFMKKKILRIGNKNITIYGDPDNDNKIKAGNVNFTRDGQLLYDAIDEEFKSYISDILDFTISKLKAINCRVIVNDKEV